MQLQLSLQVVTSVILFLTSIVYLIISVFALKKRPKVESFTPNDLITGLFTLASIAWFILGLNYLIDKVLWSK